MDQVVSVKLQISSLESRVPSIIKTSTDMLSQLTKTTSLDEVQPLLTQLCKRLLKNQASPQIICTDNCCTVRRKLQDIFGNETFICLDLFHAVQRIVKSLPKRHPLYLYCKKDVSMIFRGPMDLTVKWKHLTLKLC